VGTDVARRAAHRRRDPRAARPGPADPQARRHRRRHRGRPRPRRVGQRRGRRAGRALHRPPHGYRRSVMSNSSSRRPAPRRSSLAWQSPVAAPTPPTQEEPETAPPGAERQEEAPRPRKKATKYRHKVSFYQYPEDTGRVRGAILHTMTTEGPRTLSQFINDAVMAEVERLEAKYNGGKPFPSVGAREIGRAHV